MLNAMQPRLHTSVAIPHAHHEHNPSLRENTLRDSSFGHCITFSTNTSDLLDSLILLRLCFPFHSSMQSLRCGCPKPPASHVRTLKYRCGFMFLEGPCSGWIKDHQYNHCFWGASVWRHSLREPMQMRLCDWRLAFKVTSRHALCAASACVSTQKVSLPHDVCCLQSLAKSP